MAIADHIDYHNKVMFADNVRDLAGTSVDRSIFVELCDHESKQGEAVFIDSYGDAEDATSTALASVKTRNKDGQADYAAFLALQTPHMAVDKARSMVMPYVNEWGHTMDSLKKLVEVTDPKSKTLSRGMGKLFRMRDRLFLNAAFAPSVLRGKDTGTVAAVNMPAGQIITLANQAAFVLPVISSIKQKFEARDYTGRIYCAIPTTVKKLLIDNPDNKLTNKDFVDSTRYFTNFELPDIYGVTFISTSQLDAAISDGAASKVRFLAWAPGGIVWNQWEVLETALGVAATEKFAVKAYMKEVCNAVRNDDNLVVQGVFAA
jgi:hypothetical protein